jgi:Flp pilus assembly protein TadG
MTRSTMIDEQGAELVEFALVIVLLFSLLIGIIWVGTGFEIYATLTHAAREGARAAAVSTCFTCSPETYSTSAPQTAINNALLASSLTRTGAVFSSSCPISSSQPSVVYSCIQAVTLPGNVPGIQVQVGYTYPLIIPLVPVSSVLISANVQMRNE